MQTNTQWRAYTAITVIILLIHVSTHSPGSLDGWSYWEHCSCLALVGFPQACPGRSQGLCEWAQFFPSLWERHDAYKWSLLSHIWGALVQSVAEGCSSPQCVCSSLLPAHSTVHRTWAATSVCFGSGSSTTEKEGTKPNPIRQHKLIIKHSPGALLYSTHVHSHKITYHEVSWQ